ncbi:MAG TPA: PqqD family protein [Allosphingosinicella sp.]|jgi:hypothetical protein
MTNETARIIRCDDLLEADVNGEIVALHIEKGQCYGLNGVASRIWSMLAEPRSLDEICGTLIDEYEVDPETCRSEVEALLGELRSEGLIKSVPA